MNLAKDRLIEIAALVTDGDLNVLGDGVDVVIHTDEDALSGMIDVVTQMHTRSGLIDEVRASTVDVAQAEAMVLDYVQARMCRRRKTAPLAGNSIATDRGFIARDMPALDDYLHYRMVDVSSIKELCRRWYPRIYFGQPEKGLDPSRARRHPRVDPRAAVLPQDRVRAAARAVDQRDRGDRRRDRRRDRRHRRISDSAPEATQRLISPSPPNTQVGGDGECSSAGRAPGCGPGSRGFESRHSPHRSGGCFSSLASCFICNLSRDKTPCS